MGQISDIIKGWKSYLKKETSEVARQRALICKECPNAKIGKYEKLMPDFELKEVEGFKCTECGCPLSTAIRSADYNCPLGKW